MRKKWIFLLLIPFVFGCNPEHEGVILTGLIENLDNELFVMGGPDGSRDTVLLDETGAFTYENTDLEEANNYYLLLGKEVVYIRLAPGMEMDFYADMSNLKETMGFTGEGADINNYYSAKNKRAYDYKWSSLDEDEYRFKVDSVLADQQENLNAVDRNDPDDPFWIIEEAELLYSWANNLGSYPGSHSYYAKLPDYEAPENWFDYKDQLGLDQPENIGSRAYDSYVSTHVRQKVGEKTKLILEADSTAQVNRHLMTLETAVNELKDEKVLNHFLTTSITGAMQWTELSELEDAMEFFKDQVQDEESLAIFNEEFDAWSKLSKGAPMLEFVGKDLEGNTVSSTDFRGKYLYVDVWATWCGPCIGEIPYLKTLEADYHDRNIVFLSYSIDDDKDAWLKYVPENELGGVQIIGKGGWQSQLCKDYKVRGVPTFMFFDPEGKIITPKMTRPSSQKTRDTFDSYSDL